MFFHNKSIYETTNVSVHNEHGHQFRLVNDASLKRSPVVFDSKRPGA